MLFGVDTMITILLLYLMIGPSGAAYSVDNLIRRWWVKAKPGVVQAWFRFCRLPIPAVNEIAPAAAPDIVPSVSANVAIRLLQINLGIIYFVSGISKLQGTAWWTGEAIWGTLGNFEFAPMYYDFYLDFLAFIGQHRWLYTLIMTGGGLFTLAFEIGYIFLIWRPRLRWVFLGAAHRAARLDQRAHGPGYFRVRHARHEHGVPAHGGGPLARQLVRRRRRQQATGSGQQAAGRRRRHGDQEVTPPLLLPRRAWE